MLNNIPHFLVAYLGYAYEGIFVSNEDRGVFLFKILDNGKP